MLGKTRKGLAFIKRVVVGNPFFLLTWHGKKKGETEINHPEKSHGTPLLDVSSCILIKCSN